MARTQDDQPENSADDGAPGAPDLGSDMLELVKQLKGASVGDQLDLLDGSPDDGDGGLLAKAAEKSLTERRGRGRPKHSPNRKNGEIFDYLAQLGHKRPVYTLSLIQSVEPDDLARALNTTRLKAAQLIVQAASVLMPYDLGKMPTSLEVTRKNLHLFIAGEIGGLDPLDDDAELSILGDTPVQGE